MSDQQVNSSGSPRNFQVRILRQDAPRKPSYWETFLVDYEPDMNVISVLQRIAAKGENIQGKKVAPVAWDCGCLEEICGACTMLVNGRVRQSCSALVDHLLEDRRGVIELRPMTKFPVVRDLMVDRLRLFRALQRVDAWVPVDGYYHLGAGPQQTQHDQEAHYPLSQCMSCGCCLEACPQYTKIEIPRKPGESDEQYRSRCDKSFDTHFLGAHAISQAVLFNSHPIGDNIAGQRLDSLMAPGGLQVCGNAQNCVAVCPKEIPLTTSIARAGRATTLHAIKLIFDR
jgi:succinate dehydrogenase / fumarate reductase, iron-sulfur subunit